MTTVELKLTRKDFVSDQTVRWCPGCGDYAILASIQKVLPDIGVPKENIVFISGIGCSSRFPYYMNTYGMHSIHGRAPTIATGLAISNPDLSVWVITGDGDGLSIGGNHFIHVMRRNVNLNMVLFNNRIYGLTKGQYSPTSRQGKKTKSSPMGSLENPVNPIALALASEATFIARSLDAHTKHLQSMLYEASQHKGISFLEVYQNCVIFNPTEWGDLEDRQKRDDHIIYLEHGKPMIFGKNRDKGIVLDGFTPKVVELGNGYTEDDLLVHDETSIELAYILSSMEYPEFPAPMGVIRRVQKPTYADGLFAQIDEAQAQKGVGKLNDLYRDADLWTVTEHNQAEMKKVTGELPSIGLDEAYVEEMEQGNGHQKTAVQDKLVTEKVSTLQPNVPIVMDLSTSLAKAIRQMNAHNIGCVLVTDANDKLAGIFTERDVLNRVVGKVEDTAAATLADYMTADPITLTNEQPIAQAIHLMSLHGFRHVPIVDANNRPTGIVSFRDVIHYLKENFGQN